jgi:hypothetical protein
VVPPLEQSVGAPVSGPNTVNVTVPDAEAAAFDSVAATEEAEIAVPAVPEDGAASDNDVTVVTTVSGIEAPQPESAAPSLESPL